MRTYFTDLFSWFEPIYFSVLSRFFWKNCSIFLEKLKIFMCCIFWNERSPFTFPPKQNLLRILPIKFSIHPDFVFHKSCILKITFGNLIVRRIARIRPKMLTITHNIFLVILQSDIMYKTSGTNLFLAEPWSHKMRRRHKEVVIII